MVRLVAVASGGITLLAMAKRWFGGGMRMERRVGSAAVVTYAGWALPYGCWAVLEYIRVLVAGREARRLQAKGGCNNKVVISGHQSGRLLLRLAGG